MDQKTEPKVELELKVKKKVKAKPAGFGVRALALIVDGIVLSVIQTPLSVINGLITASLGATQQQGQVAPEMAIMAILSTIITMLISMTVGVIYGGYFLSKKGATPGKMLLGLKVINTETGKNMTFWKAAMRETLGKTLSTIFFAIGYLMAAFRDDKKTMHDLLCSSQVLKVKK
ncbi:RDD family protein [Bacteriovorax sp. DB6_IX]|uniref:RDD family protein n=1 Tax=Bacteriovorax sp. DB6_IX TaxID=1353530 RepID=UPI000389EC0A|nr:RDD family protein [Bacteriovorax sp. DB6_IX]EQC50661.1 RDD family protein [Bacteriovorax sp. DB6_IX]